MKHVTQMVSRILKAKKVAVVMVLALCALSFFMVFTGTTRAKDTFNNEIFYSFEKQLKAPVSPGSEGSQRIKIKIDNKEYMFGDVVADFLEVSFSDRLWNEEAEAVFRESGHFGRMIEWFTSRNWSLRYQDTQKTYGRKDNSWPFIADYMFNRTEWPRHSAINKWNGKVTVGFWYPQPGANDGLSHALEFLPQVEKSSIEVLSDIQKTLGVSTEFIGPEDAREETKDHARIRILPMKSWPERSSFSMKGYTHYFYNFEEWLSGSVLFESSSRKSMDGYFIPNEKNEIEVSVCKIRTNLTEVKFNKLVKECILRSLGLPDHSSYGVSESLLSPKASGETLSAYDKAMLSLLYCPKIKPGMDKFQTLRELTSNEECLANAFK